MTRVCFWTDFQTKFANFPGTTCSESNAVAMLIWNRVTKMTKEEIDANI